MTERALTPAEMYERFFVPGFFSVWAKRLVDQAGIRAGQAVLDLACGTGAVARELAPRLGAEGTVVALDLRPGMLEVARALPPPAGAPIQGEAGFPDADHFVHHLEYGFSAVVPEFAADPRRFDAFVEAVLADTKDLLARHRVGDWIRFPMAANLATGTRR